MADKIFQHMLVEELLSEGFEKEWCEAVATDSRGCKTANDQKIANAALRAMRRAYATGINHPGIL